MADNVHASNCAQIGDRHRRLQMKEWIAISDRRNLYGSRGDIH
jgi:hypothetical protein